MATINELNKILEESNALKLVAQAYTEISAIKLRKIRAGIERNRNFFQEVTEVYHIVSVEAVKKGLSTAKKRGTISILLTSNHHFYGGLERELVKFFLVNTSLFKTDRITVGAKAKDFLETLKYFHSYKHLVFKSDLPTSTEIRDLVSQIIGYEQIMVYYPRMHSVLVQEPHVVDIVQKPPPFYLNVQVRAVDYIFEPEIEKMLTFFENQITLLLLEQTFLESELARTAARLTSMDEAQTNADELIKKQRKELFQAIRSFDNIRLLESINTMSRKKTDGE